MNEYGVIRLWWKWLKDHDRLLRCYIRDFSLKWPFDATSRSFPPISPRTIPQSINSGNLQKRVALITIILMTPTVQYSGSFFSVREICKTMTELMMMMVVVSMWMWMCAWWGERGLLQIDDDELTPHSSLSFDPFLFFVPFSKHSPLRFFLCSEEHPVIHWICHNSINLVS